LVLPFSTLIPERFNLAFLWFHIVSELLSALGGISYTDFPTKSAIVPPRFFAPTVNVS
jgi:hypothetical protein